MQTISNNNESNSTGVVTGAFELFDPEELTEVVPGSNFEHTQLSAGNFKGAWLHANLGKTVFGTAAYNLPVLAEGAYIDDVITIGCLLDSNGDKSTAQGQNLLPNTLVVWAEHTEAHVRLAPNPHWCIFSMTRDDLESLGVQVEKDLCRIFSLTTQAHIRVKTAFIESIDLLMQIHYRRPEIIDYAGAYKAIQETLSTVISSELLTLYSDSDSIRASSMFQRYDLVRRAESFIDSNGYEKISIAQLCENLRTTVRRLELAFRDIHGLNPKNFVMMKKFTAVRKELLYTSPDRCSVSEVAMHHGFFHMGRFSTTYKKLFAESPRATLARRCPRGVNGRHQ